MNKDRYVLRDLVEKYLEISHSDKNGYNRRKWRNLHSRVATRPLVHVRHYLMLHEVPEVRNPLCTNPVFRAQEAWLRSKLFLASLDDDSYFEPFLTMSAVKPRKHQPLWGFPGVVTSSNHGAVNAYEKPPIQNEDDLQNIRIESHTIDYARTMERFFKLYDAVGDLVDIHIGKSPIYSNAISLSLSTTLLLGMEQMMYLMIDNPDLIHAVQKKLSDGILQMHKDAEVLGDWQLPDSVSQSFAASDELPGATPNTPCRRKDLATFAHAQDFTGASPDMFEEFVLQYQKPIIEAFGESSYGCCENVTCKIDVLRQIGNLKTISITPSSDLEKCVEQIGTDYVMSWRPNPAEMVCCGFNEDRIRKTIREGLEIMKGCQVEVNLKDIITVQGEPQRLKRWVEIVREEIDALYS